MTYASILYINKNNCDFIQNKCRVISTCNQGKTCKLECADGSYKVMDIVHLVKDILDNKIAITNPSKIRQNIEKLCVNVNNVRRQ